MPTDFPFRGDEHRRDPQRRRGGSHPALPDWVVLNLGSLLTLGSLAVLGLGICLGAWWFSPSPPSAALSEPVPYRPAPPVVARPSLPTPPATILLDGVPVTPPPASVFRRPADGLPSSLAPFPTPEPQAAPRAIPAAPTVEGLLLGPGDRPERGFGEFDIPDGVRLRDIGPVTGGTRLYNLVGDWLRLPTRDFGAASDLWKGSEEISPIGFGVTAEGVGVSTMPTTKEVGGAIAFLLMASLSAIVLGVAAQYVGYWLGFHHVIDNHYEDRPGWVRRVEGCSLTAFLLLLLAIHPGVLSLLLWMGSVLLLGSDWRDRAKWFSTLGGIGAVVLALRIPIVSPHAALVEAYGPLGLYGWDVVATALAAAILLVQWIPLPRGRVTYVTVSGPR